MDESTAMEDGAFLPFQWRLESTGIASVTLFALRAGRSSLAPQAARTGFALQTRLTLRPCFAAWAGWSGFT